MSELLPDLTNNAPFILRTLLLYELQVTVFALIVWGIDRWLRQAYSGFRYALWLVVLVKALWPPSFTIPRLDILPAMPIELPVLAVTATTTSSSSVPLVQQSSLPPASIPLLVWGLLSAGLLVLMLISFVTFRLRLRAPHSYPWQPGVDSPPKGRRWPPIWFTDRIPSPLTLGLIRPRIYLTPEATAADPATLDAILHHELAHVRRRDGWVTLLQAAALVIHPFNPLVWLMNRRLTSYREQVCDDFALRHTGITPYQYGQALIDQLRRSVPSPLMLHPKTLFFETKRDLKQRLQQLLNRKESTMNTHTTTKQKLLLAGLMAGLLLVVSQCQQETEPTLPTLTQTEMENELNQNRVTSVTLNADGQILHDGELIPQDQLQVRIKELLAQNPDLVVIFYPHPDTYWERSNEVADEISLAGATRILNGIEIELNPRNVTNVLVNATGQVLHDDDPIPLDQLAARISSMLDQNTNLVIGFKTSPSTPMEIVLNVYEEIHRAGATRILYEGPGTTPPAPAYVRLDPDSVSVPFIPYDAPPRPIGGYEALMQQAIYPEEAKAAGIQGTVIIYAFIDENGQVGEIRIIEGTDTILDNAALAAVLNTTFTPAKRGGEPVGTWLAMPIVFQPSEEAGGQSSSDAVRQRIESLDNQSEPYRIIDATQEFGKIHGMVTMEATGRPLPGVNIILERTTMGAATDEDGRYSIIDVPPGTYTLRALFIGLESVVFDEVIVRAMESTELNFSMRSTTVKIEDYSGDTTIDETEQESFEWIEPPPPPDDAPSIPFIPYDEGPVPIDGYHGIQSRVEYPQIAREAGIEGQVLVYAFIDTDGIVKETMILRSIPMLDDAAVDAVKGTRFSPAKQRDQVVAVWLSIPIDFRLDG